MTVARPQRPSRDVATVARPSRPSRDPARVDVRDVYTEERHNIMIIERQNAVFTMRDAV
jgi:hypothetical protein